jgi:hypothetical protein
MTKADTDELLALVLRLVRSDERLKNVVGVLEASVPQRIVRLEATLRPFHTLQRVFGVFQTHQRDAARTRAVMRVSKEHSGGDTAVERVFRHLATLLSDYTQVRRRVVADADVAVPSLTAAEMLAPASGADSHASARRRRRTSSSSTLDTTAVRSTTGNRGHDDNDDDNDDQDDDNHNNDDSAAPSSTTKVSKRRRKSLTASTASSSTASTKDAAPANPLLELIDVQPAGATDTTSSATTVTEPRTNKRKKSMPRKKTTSSETTGVAGDGFGGGSGVFDSWGHDDPRLNLSEDALMSLLRNDEAQFETAESLAQHINQVVAASSLGHLAGARSAQSNQTLGPLLDDHDVDAIIHSFYTDPVGARLLSPARVRPTAATTTADEDAHLMPPPATTPLRRRVRAADEPPQPPQPQQPQQAPAPPQEPEATPVDIDSFLADLHGDDATSGDDDAVEAVDVESFLSQLHGGETS